MCVDSLWEILNAEKPKCLSHNFLRFLLLTKYVAFIDTFLTSRFMHTTCREIFDYQPGACRTLCLIFFELLEKGFVADEKKKKEIVYEV